MLKRIFGFIIDVLIAGRKAGFWKMKDELRRRREERRSQPPEKGR